MAEEKPTKRGNRFKDISGQRFGRLIIISVAESATKSKKLCWNCICDCGNTTIIPTGNITNGHTQSCGCLSADKDVIGKNWKHGMSDTREYHAWRAARNRCTNPEHPEYRRYGARGIFMCELWLNSFETFLSDMGRCPDGLTLDRKDNNGPYSPDNCRWVTAEAQAHNQEKTIHVTHNGETLCLKEWSRKTGIHYSTLRKRYQKGRPLFDPPQLRYSRRMVRK